MKKKSVYDIGDWVYIRWSNQYDNLLAIILDINIDGLDTPLYQILIQTKPTPIWMHHSAIVGTL